MTKAKTKATNLQSKRQPRKHARRLAANVACANEQAMARDFGIHRVFTEGTDKELGEASWHPPTLPVRK